MTGEMGYTSRSAAVCSAPTALLTEHLQPGVVRRMAETESTLPSRTVTLGLCECGCGKTTTVADRTRKEAHVVKGQYRRFRAGHNPHTKVAALATVVCAHCGIEFKAPLHRVRTTKYCSRSCHNNSMRRPDEQKFWEKVNKDGPMPKIAGWTLGQCWVWTGKLSYNGYGGFTASDDGRRDDVRAHRWSYEQERGRIPRGKQLDHLCRNRACVRPSHTEAVTCKTNIRRGHISRRLEQPSDGLPFWVSL